MAQRVRCVRAWLLGAGACASGWLADRRARGFCALEHPVAFCFPPRNEPRSTPKVHTKHIRVATYGSDTNGKKYRVRYIAATPVALRGTQPSQTGMLVKPSASEAKAAPDPDM